MKPVVRLRPAGPSCAHAHYRNRGLLAIRTAAFLICATFSAMLIAQTAHFSGAISNFLTTLQSPAAVAVDATGNIFYAEQGSTTVKELLASNGYATPVNIPGSFTTPAGLAVDAAGNLYVADSTAGTVTQVLAAGGFATANVLGSGITAPTSVAIDALGNVFVTDAADGTVKELLAAGGFGAASTVGTGFSYPVSLAIDSSNNVFVLDAGTQIITELLASGAYTTSNALSATFTHPLAIAADRAGNLFVADANLSNITELTGTGYATAVPLGAGLSYPFYLAADAKGNLIVNDSGNHAIKQIALGGANAGSAPTGGLPSRTVYFVFTFDTGGSIAAPSVLTQGAPNLDFTDLGNGSCTTNGSAHMYAPQDFCWVNVSFTPGLPGSRFGAVVLSDLSGNTLTNGYIYGTGTGPQAVFLAATPAQIDPTLTTATSVAVDSAGNLFVADASNNLVLGEQGGVPSSVASAGLSSPLGIALDGAGALYIADTGNNRVVKQTPSAGGYVLSVVTSTGAAPSGVAVDGSGNVYIADTGNNRVIKDTLTAAGYVETVLPTSTLSAPQGVAVDAHGRVYIADTGNNRVLVETPSSTGYTETTIGSSLSAPVALAVTSGGAVLIADSGSNRIMAETLIGGSYYQSVLATTPAAPTGVAVSPTGDVYFAVGILQTLAFSAPPSFTFPSTAQGSASASQTITFTNIGNAPLTFPTPFSGYNPSIAANFSLDSSSGTACPLLSSLSAPTTLTAGATCTLSVSFVPTAAGSVSGSLVITDDNLNAPTSSQTLSLSGTATLPVPSVTFTVADHAYGDAAFTLSASSASTGAFTYSVVSGPAILAGDSLTVTGTGVVSLSVAQAADSNYDAGSATTTFNVIKATPAITFAVAGKTYGDAAFTVSASSASSGAFTYSVVSGPVTISGSTVTITGTGAVVLSVSQAADTHYNSGTQTAAFTINTATAVISFSVSGKTYGDAAFGVSASSASSGALTYTVVSGPATISGSTVTLSGAGSVTLLASQAADSNYTSNTQSVTFNVAKATAAISFAVADKTYGDAAFGVSASSASSGAITYTVVSGPATISGSTVTLSGAGSVTLLASQAADSNYTSNTQSVTFNVAKATAAISFAVADKTYGDAAFGVSASSASSGALTYTVVSGPATISGSTVTLSGAGSVTLLASQAADSNYTSNTQSVTFNVAAAMPTIAFTVPGHTFGDAPFSVSATSASAGAFTYGVVSGPATISGAIVTLTGAGPVVLSASQAAAGNYAIATQNASFNAGVGSAALTFAVPNHVLGDAAFSVSATSASTGAITYGVVSGPATLSGSTVTLTGAGTVVLSATQAADSNYASATQNATFTIMARAIWIANASSALSAFDTSGSAVSGSNGYTGGGLGSIATPLGMAFDHANAVWIANTSGGVSKFNADGTPASSGFHTGGISHPRAIAVDGDGQVWTANSNGSVSALSNAGSAITPGSGYTGSGMGTPGAIAIDLSGNVWVTNSSDDSVTELIGVAAPAAPLSASASAGARP